MPRLLLLLPTTTYRAAAFLDAAARLGVEVAVASEEANALEAVNPAGLLTLDWRDPEAAARRAVELSRDRPFDAVVGVDDDTAVAAAAIARALGPPHNPVPAAAAARHKGQMRDRLSAAGVPVPRHRVFRRADGSESAAASVRYPCVLKPTFLAASRGVIRADDPAAFAVAWQRIGVILDDPEVARRGGGAAGEILVEDFVPGREVALEGLLTAGALRVLALFDKPDPLDGPFFEETIYVTPSRLPEATQDAIARTAAAAARALGLTEGPVHAELRLAPSGPVVIELAARSIGGLCSRTLRFGTGMSLEELILRHALRLPAEAPRDQAAAGVLMIPIRRRGTLERVTGLEEARAVIGIVEATITLRPGQELIPLPEGSRYLGFLFSRAEKPEEAERALREAHSKLGFETKQVSG
ncbi:MAG: ATP-grasp domain-containing protein [Acidobacteriota bacterium]|nr:ATP-grasp domain-containing protein [Acidobacteriota bacterium]